MWIRKGVRHTGDPCGGSATWIIVSVTVLSRRSSRADGKKHLVSQALDQ